MRSGASRLRGDAALAMSPGQDAVDLKKSLTLAVRPSIVLRGLKFSLVVGTLLVLINHGDRLFTEGVTLTQALQIALTYAVPYAVSSLSSIQAMLSRDDEAEA